LFNLIKNLPGFQIHLGHSATIHYSLWLFLRVIVHFSSGCHSILPNQKTVKKVSKKALFSTFLTLLPPVYLPKGKYFLSFFAIPTNRASDYAKKAFALPPLFCA